MWYCVTSFSRVTDMGVQSKGHIDLRVKRSQAAIRAAVVSLLSEKPTQDITAKDVAERALINKKTFYAHYPSVRAVLQEIENDAVSEVSGIVESGDVSTPCWPLEGALAAQGLGFRRGHGVWRARPHACPHASLRTSQARALRAPGRALCRVLATLCIPLLAGVMRGRLCRGRHRVASWQAGSLESVS
jgi:AcrR family transcriptional regulator